MYVQLQLPKVLPVLLMYHYHFHQLSVDRYYCSCWIIHYIYLLLDILYVTTNIVLIRQYFVYIAVPSINH